MRWMSVRFALGKLFLIFFCFGSLLFSFELKRRKSFTVQHRQQVALSRDTVLDIGYHG